MKTQTKQTAYDYENQRWVTDENDAITLRLAQLDEELTLLQGPRGADFAKFINVDRSKAISAIMLEQLKLRLTTNVK